jgi:biopolymer transport protein ExbD
VSPVPSSSPSAAARLLAPVPGGRRRARIEIIPLIDVIFFLLATFVLFTLSLNQSGGPRVALPEAGTGETRNPRGAVTITVRADGSLAWDKRAITTNDLLVRLQALKQTDPDPRVLLNGDRDALFAHLRYVADEARKAGIAKILVETRLRSTTAP